MSEGVAEFRGTDDFDFGVVPGKSRGEAGPGPRSEGEAAATVLKFLDEALAGVERRCGGVQTENDGALARPVPGVVGGAAEDAGGVGDDIAAGNFASGEPGARGGARGDPVGAEGTPIPKVEVEGDEVPASLPGDDGVWFDATRRLPVVWSPSLPPA